MNFFSISDIENLTSIKAHTLRIWEQRYGICVPKRKESSHRYYDAEDLKEILRIAYLYHQGHRISSIAKLSSADIEKLALNSNGLVSSYEHYLNRLLEASIDLDQSRFESVLTEAITLKGFENSMAEIVVPFLKKLGMFWLTGHIIPSQEHFASNIISHKILAETDRLPRAEKSLSKRKVLLFCPEREFHEIPLLHMNYLLRKAGVFVIYMGVNSSLEALEYYCQYHPVDELYFHLLTNFTKVDQSTYLELLADKFPKKKIFCSGASLEKLVILPANVKYLSSGKEILAYANGLL